ncbi:tRNA guanosine(34) transglycosylase Tgt, partial [Mesorhizobium sp. M00.F.Ca.ET.216.01.1.1]
SRAYLHHLVRSQESLGAMLLTWNNLSYYQTLMRDIRAAIEAQAFEARAAEISEGWARGDIPAI